MEKTNFDRIAASTGTMATFLSSLPTMTGPWDEAFDRHFCAACSVQDCNAEGCPHKQVRDSVIWWWLGLAEEVDDSGGNHPGG